MLGCLILLYPGSHLTWVRSRRAEQIEAYRRQTVNCTVRCMCLCTRACTAGVRQTRKKKLMEGDHLAAQCVWPHGTITSRLTLTLTTTLANGTGNDSSFSLFWCLPAREQVSHSSGLPEFFADGTASVLPRAWSFVDLQYDEKSSQHLPQSRQGSVRYHGNMLGPQQG